MAKSPRKRKSRPAMTTTEIKARSLAQYGYLAYVPVLMEGVYYCNFKGVKQTIGAKVANALGDMKAKWSVTLYVIRKDNNGKYKLDAEVHSVAKPCRHEDLIEYLTDEHLGLLQGAAQKFPETIVTPAWIACVNGNSPPQHVAFKIFEELGVMSELYSRKEAMDAGLIDTTDDLTANLEELWGRDGNSE